MKNCWLIKERNESSPLIKEIVGYGWGPSPLTRFHSIPLILTNQFHFSQLVCSAIFEEKRRLKLIELIKESWMIEEREDWLEWNGAETYNPLRVN